MRRPLYDNLPHQNHPFTNSAMENKFRIDKDDERKEKMYDTTI